MQRWFLQVNQLHLRKSIFYNVIININTKYNVCAVNGIYVLTRGFMKNIRSNFQPQKEEIILGSSYTEQKNFSNELYYKKLIEKATKYVFIFVITTKSLKIYKIWSTSPIIITRILY